MSNSQDDSQSEEFLEVDLTMATTTTSMDTMNNSGSALPLYETHNRKHESDGSGSSSAAKPGKEGGNISANGQHDGNEVTLFGFYFPNFGGNTKLKTKVLIVSIIVVYLVFYLLQESLFKKKKCKSGGFVSLIHFIMFFTFGLIDRKKVRPDCRKRRGPIKYHLYVGFFCIAGFSLSNYSMQLLNFPTWLLFKSARVLVTMLGGVFINGKRYGPYEYSGVFCIFLGLVVFSWGDWKVLPSFNLPGILLVVLALIMNSAQDNFQEKGMRKYNVTENEMVIYSYGTGALMLAPYLLISGELFQGIHFVMENPIGFAQIIFSGFLAYVGVVLVLALLRQTSALVAVITTSCRKALSIILSFIVFSKPFSMNYVYGTVLVFSGVFLNFYGKRKRPKEMN